MKIKKIAIVGLGGVGGYFGFKLAETYTRQSDLHITFVARKQTYNQIRENGLTLLSPEHKNKTVHPDQLLDDVSGLSGTDLIILCVKEYDLEKICNSLKNILTPDAVILPLMNGVDIYERIRKIIPAVIVLPTCVYITSHIREKGVIVHKGKPGKIITGKDPMHPDYDPQEVAAIFKTAGIQIDSKIDSIPYLWIKFCFIASFGLVTARYDKPIGSLLEEPELHKRTRLIMEEIIAIAKKKGIVLPQDIVDQSFERAAMFPYHTPTSLQLDVQSGKKHTELSLFAGAIINYGNEVNVPVTETYKIYNEIKKLFAI